MGRTLVAKLVAPLAAAAVVTSALTGTAGPAGASATAPTVTAAATVRYYAVVAVSGTTPAPSEAVEFYSRHVGTTTWAHRALRPSGADARFATAFRETADTQFYVRSAGASSPVRTTRVVRATCSSTGPIFKALPFEASPTLNGRASGDFADVSAYRNGLWAGVMFQDFTGDFYVYTLRRGHPKTILARYRYRGIPFYPSGSVAIKGITPTNDVVAAVESTHGSAYALVDVPTYGVYWAGRTRHYLSHARSWIEWMPNSVTDSGEIVGYAATGRLSHEHRYVVAWSRASAHYRVIADLGYSGAGGIADRAGDIAWTAASGYAVVRTASGRVHELRSAPLTAERYESQWIYVTGAGLHTFYASDNPGVHAWTVSDALPPGPLVETGLVSGWDSGNTFVDAVGRRGDLVVDLAHPWLVTARGARVRMPAELYPDNSPTRVITDGGRIAYTSARDHRVHIMTCH